MAKFFLAVLAMALFAGMIFAGCSESAYRSGCASCKFDNATKKFDRSCTDAKKAEGIACLSASYPIAMNNYRNGNCSQVDECISQLNSCTAQYNTGNEKADCDEGSLSVCYAGADQCFQSAAGKCSDIKNTCAAPAGIIIIGGGAVILMALFGNRKSAAPMVAKR